MRFFITAGETSGDAIGAELVLELRKRVPNAVFRGIGGVALREAGLEPTATMDALNVMGVTEVLRNYTRLRRLLGETAKEVQAFSPAALITIDSPDFSIRLAKLVGRTGGTTKRVQYVCPSVWAWRAQRAKTFAQENDLLLSVQDFDAPWFERFGGQVAFVGHPAAWRVANALAQAGSRPTARQELGLSGDKGAVLFLAGSRPAELRHNLPVLLATAQKFMQNAGREIEFLAPTLAPFAEQLTSSFARAKLPAKVITDEAEKWRAFRGADLALAVSGTVVLETALAQIPTVMVYATRPANYALLRPFLTEPLRLYGASLPNLIAKKRVIPEHWRPPLRANAIAQDLLRLLPDAPPRQEMLKSFASLGEQLLLKDAGAPQAPATCAAQKILQLVA